MNLRSKLTFLLVLLPFSFLSLSQAQTFQKVLDNFDLPVAVTHADDGTNRLFVVEKTGRIYISQDGEVLEPAFLDVSDIITASSNEQGLLGLAFHPNYAENGRLFVNYTANGSGDTVVAEYNVSNDPNLANANSGKEILRFGQPYGNHNAGHLAFSPKDGYLYIGTGDGGSGGDPEDYAENLSSYLGKMLRIDVDSAEPYAIPGDNPYLDTEGVLPEIWAHGLRNPWRYSFDRETADLYIGDVGQREYEEINFQSSESTGKENYGWDIMEGFHCFEPSRNCDQEGLTLPVAEYGHNRRGGVSVTGGYVYRGTNIPDLYGKYIYGDFGSGRIWMLERQDNNWNTQVLAETDFNISSFGEDEAGELYLADYGTGSIYKFVPDSSAEAIND